MRTRAFPVLLVLAAWTAPPPLAAQTRAPLFTRMGKFHLPPSSPPGFHDCAILDFDRDGRPDIAAAREDSIRLYRNMGGARFADETSTRLPAAGIEPTRIVAADLDGDGAPDLAASGQGKLVLLMNDGKGKFKNASANLPALQDIPGDSLAAADVDGDKDLDLLAGGRIQRTGKNLLLVNDGKGRFRLAGGGEWTKDTSGWKFLPVDADGDGDPDLLSWAPRPAFQPRLYLNDGKGRFTLDRSNRIPQAILQVETLAPFDIDGDGDLDLFLGTNRGYLFYENKGKGFFKDMGRGGLPPRSAPVSALLPADLDGDGRPDLAAGGASDSLSLRRNRLYRNLGKGSFKEIPAGDLGSSRQFTRKLLAADLDGDKDPDLLVQNDRSLELLLNDGKGVFTSATASPLPRLRQVTRDLALADFDGDGFLDLFLGNSNGSVFVEDPDRLLLGDGTGGFVDGGPGRTPVLHNVASRLPLAGDVDGDGDPDLVVGTDWRTRLFLNDGKGRFRDGTSGRLPPDMGRTDPKALVDLDGDGDLDLLVDRYFAMKNTPVLFNDGKGAFRPDTKRIPIQNSFLLAWGDTDGDGDTDLLLGYWDMSNFQCRPRIFQFTNNGKGIFSNAFNREIPLSKNTGSSFTAVEGLHDLDGDGDLDLLACDGRDLFSWVNNGKGFFTYRKPKVPAPCERILFVADLLGEGKPQVVGVRSGRAVLFRGGPDFKADPRWTLPSEWVLGMGGPFRFETADLDGDGDLDVAATGYDRYHLLYYNRLHQVSSPYLARPGGKWRLEFHALGTARSVLPMVAGARGKTPFPPLGLFQLAPNSLWLFPALRIPAGGTGVLAISIPADPALAGGRIYFQALFVDGRSFSRSRLSNLVVETFAP